MNDDNHTEQASSTSIGKSINGLDCYAACKSVVERNVIRMNKKGNAFVETSSCYVKSQ
jgi:hypothetical protein